MILSTGTDVRDGLPGLLTPKIIAAAPSPAVPLLLVPQIAMPPTPIPDIHDYAHAYAASDADSAWPTVTPTPTSCYYRPSVWKSPVRPARVHAPGWWRLKTRPWRLLQWCLPPQLYRKQRSPWEQSSCLCLGVGPKGSQNRAHAFPADINFDSITLPCGDKTVVFTVDQCICLKG